MSIAKTDSIEKERRRGAQRNMLLVSIASMVMIFAALTSAYIVRKDSSDWIDIELPSAFLYSTLVIILSSFTIHIAYLRNKKGRHAGIGMLLLVTFFMGLIFSILQFMGFSQLISEGIFFTGKSSKISGSFIYVLTITHLVHLFLGLVCLLIAYLRKLRPHSTLLWIAMVFWHFLGMLWLYLYSFMSLA